MIDILPFPRISEGTPERQIVELTNYLVQLKETLEFALSNISTDNLSADLVEKLNQLGVNIEQSNKSREEEIAQVSTKSLTVSDVCNSEIFKSSVTSQVSKITFFVNFETGNLDFATSQGG
jgi:hypothetical protein